LELLETYVKKLEQNQIAERAEVTKKYELRKKIEKLEDEVCFVLIFLVFVRMVFIFDFI
jgi:hypothetical protein